MPSVRHVIITVKKAELTESFIMFGKMDPYATVEWVNGKNGEKELISRTHTDWNAHKHPVWDFTCRGHKYDLEETNVDKIKISIYEDDGKWLGSKLMGSVHVTAKSLLGISRQDNPSTIGDMEDDALGGHTMELNLTHKNGSGKIIGKIYVQAQVVDSLVSASKLEESRTEVDSDFFQVPVKRLGVSGGSAPFFELTISKTKVTAGSCRTLSASRYIGKDLSRARDELEFYEELNFLRKQKSKLDAMRFNLLLDFTFEYKGIFTALEEGQPDSSLPLELLVLENLHDGFNKLRMLDLKIGRQTAQAGWQGKSKGRAWKQFLVDGSTNSVTEGYRLEGFDNMPLALQSREPLLDLDKEKASEKNVKKARRIMFQALPADHIFMYFLDLRKEPGRQEDLYTNVELAELFLNEIVERLVRLSLACHRVKIPQKWIGSSVALGFDADFKPSRSENVNSIRSKVRVNIFDWGRSELNTVGKHVERDKKDDRSQFWGYYKEGIDMMSWQAARTYFRQFCCKSWTTIEVNVLDFDAVQVDQTLGKITLPLTDMPLHSYELAGGTGTVSLSIEWWEAPHGSRLKGSWRVSISHANGLINKDTFSLSDPYCLITAKSPTRCFQQVTSVKENTLDPVWNEIFDLPIAIDPDDNLIDALECGAKGITDGVNTRNMLGFEAGTYDLNDVRVSYGTRAGFSREAIKEWTSRLEECAKDGASRRELPAYSRH